MISSSYSLLGQNGTLDDYYASIYAVLKDNNCKDAIELTISSHKQSVRRAAGEQGFDIENVATTEGSDFSIKPVQLVLNNNLDRSVREEVKLGLEKIKFTNFNYKVIEDPEGKHNFH